MIEKFARAFGSVPSEFRDLNHTNKKIIVVSLAISKLARDGGGASRRTSQSGH